MPVYEYRCKGCDKHFETDKIVEGREFRHMKDDVTPLEICGEVVRVWSANVNVANLKAARG